MKAFDNVFILVMTFFFMCDTIFDSTGYSFDGWLAFLGPEAGHYLVF